MNRFDQQFADSATDEIIRMLNAGKSNRGVTGARIEWHLELRNELTRRGIDCSAIEQSGGELKLEGPELVRLRDEA